MADLLDPALPTPQSLDGNPFGWTVTIEEFGGNVPVQGSGTVRTVVGDVFCWYFRARGDGWTLDVGASLDAHGLVPEGEELFQAHGVYGPWPAAGWMSVEEAARYLHDALTAFSRGARGYWEHPKPCGTRTTREELVAILAEPVVWTAKHEDSDV